LVRKLKLRGRAFSQILAKEKKKKKEKKEKKKKTIVRANRNH
jgi:hypothetical protein